MSAVHDILSCFSPFPNTFASSSDKLHKPVVSFLVYISTEHGDDFYFGIITIPVEWTLEKEEMNDVGSFG